MTDFRKILCVRGKWCWVISGLLILTAGLTGLVWWFGNISFVSHAPLFRGKPESEWIKNLKYNDNEEAKEWQAYCEEGVQVLIRGLQKAKRPGDRAYRSFHRRLPASLGGLLPAPKPDSTYSTRMRIVSLLRSLASEARSAIPVMIQTALNDESYSVQGSAIGFFNYNGGESCPLNQLTARQKKALLPAYVDAFTNPGKNELRHNASIGLKYFPEERQVVVPILVNALQDPDAYVRLYAAEALNRIAPDAAKKAGAVSVLVTIAKHPDDQVASKAVSALGHAGSPPDLAVPALIECLQSTNAQIACEAVWALEYAPAEFAAYSATIVPALTLMAERKDWVGGYARTAQARWKSRSDAKQGAK